MASKNVTPQQLAEQWCAKHPEVVTGDANSGTAMDKAVKIIALETSTDKGRSELFRAAAPFGVSFLDSTPGQAHPATDFLGARDIISSAKAAAASGNSTAAPRGTAASALAACPYCNEPSSRFCKESGRRHETADEKAERRWKHVFRQLSLASSFVNNARLNKKNSCVGDSGGVELIL